ncbi:MAG: NfeD family protein [Leptospirillia bacterium]
MTGYITFAVVAMAALGGVFWYARWKTWKAHVHEVEQELAQFVGRRAVVTEGLNPGPGTIRIDGEGYQARTINGVQVGPRVLVEVVGVRHTELLVRKVYGQARLIDVDEIEKPLPNAREG